MVGIESARYFVLDNHEAALCVAIAQILHAGEYSIIKCANDYQQNCIGRSFDAIHY